MKTQLSAISQPPVGAFRNAYSSSTPGTPLPTAAVSLRHGMEQHDRLDAEAVTKIQLFSVEPGVKEICKRVKQCHSSHLHVSF